MFVMTPAPQTALNTGIDLVCDAPRNSRKMTPGRAAPPPRWRPSP